MKKWVLLISLCFAFVAGAQLFQHKNFGGTVGVTINMGTHINRIGVNVNSFYYYKFFQINSGAQFNVNLSNWEGFEFGTEINPYAGVQFYFGDEGQIPQPFIHETSLNSGSKYGVGYTFKYYWSTLGTSQTSGVFGLHVKNLSFAVENDILGFNGRDRFRTSAVGISYRYDNMEFAIQNILWTGETRGVPTVKDSSYRARLGVKDISTLKYGKVSHGVITAKFNYLLPYGQTFNASLGWDAENIRHWFQNKLIHDVIKNPHYPMLDHEGNPMYKTGKEKRKSELFLQVGLNNYGFY